MRKNRKVLFLCITPTYFSQKFPNVYTRQIANRYQVGRGESFLNSVSLSDGLG